MKRTFVAAIIFTSYVALSPVSGQTPALEQTERERCSYDHAALMALDQHAFDQNMKGGWRAVARQDQCIAVAADLIRDYRKTRNLESAMLYWHEGQLRATVGETEKAIQLFEKSRKPQDADRIGWNFYVDATIAFLKQDRTALLNAREALARLPRPADFEPRDQAGNLLDVPWPPNLDVIDRLIACFGRDYEEAYGHCEK